MTKIGVIGAGHLGKIHLKILKTLKPLQLVGFYDSDPDTAAAVEKEFKVKAFASATELIQAVEAVDIVTPTVAHYEVAKQAIQAFKHIFIEKPITQTLDEARSLFNLASEAKVCNQVGHVERFNPAYLALADMELNPLFIETHRLALWNPRGTDVSVVLDLMIHDIDILLQLIKSPVKKISASGVCIISETPDIATARIEFNNGAVANLTASRISAKNMRKTRIFQKNSYISLDLLNKQCEVHTISDYDPEIQGILIETGSGNKMLTIAAQKPVKDSNAIQMELELFADAIKNKKESPVNFAQAYEVLRIAHQVIEKIQHPM